MTYSVTLLPLLHINDISLILFLKFYVFSLDMHFHEMYDNFNKSNP